MYVAGWLVRKARSARYSRDVVGSGVEFRGREVLERAWFAGPVGWALEPLISEQAGPCPPDGRRQGGQGPACRRGTGEATGAWQAPPI